MLAIRRLQPFIVLWMWVQCKEPSKALPIGIVGSLIVVTTFYILASLTLTLMVPVDAIDASAGTQPILFYSCSFSLRSLGL